MAKVKWGGTETVQVPELGNKTVKPGDIVDVPDDRFEGFVPPKAHRSAGHPWTEITAPTKAAKKAASTVKDN